MADIFTPQKRSEVMSAIRSKDTKPELRVRSQLHRKGFRFRLHGRGLPGKPDIILSRYRSAIFVHGCFWHLHEGCADARLPKSRTEFWAEKLTRNVARDKRNQRELRAMGWKVIVVWECELKNEHRAIERIQRELTGE